MTVLSIAGSVALALCLGESSHPDDTAVVTRVVDGDTIVVVIGAREEKVRLIGVDTPEAVHPRKPVEPFAREASAFTKALAEGKVVRLEADPQLDPPPRRATLTSTARAREHTSP